MGFYTITHNVIQLSCFPFLIDKKKGSSKPPPLLIVIIIYFSSDCIKALKSNVAALTANI